MAAKTSEIRVGEAAVIARDTGGPAARTFLLVHGIGMGRAYFAELSDELAPHGRVISIDLPGFGDSPEPAMSLPMSGMGRVLIEFVEQAGLSRPVLVGHSMGTEVVAEAAAQRPELFPELVLIAPTVNLHERTVARQAWRMCQDLFGESPKVVLMGLRSYIRTGPRWFIKKLQAMMAHEVELVFPTIRAHTLVIRGGRDRVCPRAWVQEVTALIPDARLVEIPGRGHETMVQDATAVARTILEHVGE